MGNNELFKLIVPAVLLLVWALNQLFNKEVNPPINRGTGLGPRPGGLPPAPRSMDRGTGGNADDVLVIRPETIRAQPRPGTSVAARRQARAKPAAPAPAKRPEPAPSRTLGAPLSQGVAQTIDRPLDVRPLAQATSAQSESAKVTAPIGPATVPNPALLGLRAALGSPARLRETFVLNELLQPPLALRGRRRV
jgi:hypothetical protein